MTEQHPTNIFSPAASSRHSDAQLMALQFFNSSNRMDCAGVPQGATAIPYPSYIPVYPMRGADQNSIVYRQMNAPVHQYAPYDAQMQPPAPITTHQYGGHISLPSQPYPHGVYSQMTQITNQEPTQYQSFQQSHSVVMQNIPPKNVPVRERKPLAIFDPSTGAQLNLTYGTPNLIKSVKNELIDKVSKGDTPSAVSNNQENVNYEIIEKPSVIQIEECVLPDSTASNLDACPSDVDTDLPIDQLSKESRETADEAQESDTESFSDSDTEYAHPGRRTYSRDFILECKNSPIAATKPKELENFLLPRYHKGSRVNHRHAPRIITLPTGVKVKRIEGAFVPSKLREKNDEENDQQKQMSKRLNIILNRMSDVNLDEAVSDIQNLKFSTVEDTQMLANLVFEKCIRQVKYVKVFASLCKQLKSFDLPGDHSLDTLVIRRTQEMFQTPLETLISKLNATIDAKIAGAKDDATKKVLEEDRETNIIKKTESYYANVEFLGHLYLNRLLSVKTVSECLKKLSDSNTSESLNSIIVLLKTCGHTLDTDAKHAVDSSFKRLERATKTDKLPSYQVYKIQELVELRSRNWKELGVKTVVPSQSGRPRPIVSHIPDTKRKSVPPNHPVTPATLAVTQQSSNNRKLGPNYTPWASGSGHLRHNEGDDGHSTERPNETSPSVTPNAWNTPLVATLAGKREAYEDILQRMQTPASKIVESIEYEKNYCIDLMRKSKERERSAILHAALDILMDKRSKHRDLIGSYCCVLLDENILKETDIISGFQRYFDSCDEEWSEEYPLGWKYIAEVLQQLIQPSQKDWFKMVIKTVSSIRSDSRAAIVIAHALDMSLPRCGKETLSRKWQENNLNWTELGVPTEELSVFTDKYLSRLDFTHTSSQLKDLSIVMDNPTQENVTQYFRQLTLSELPQGFIPNCVQLMVQKSKDFSRLKVDPLAVGLGILIDHNSTREMEALQGIQGCDVGQDVKDRWVNSLVHTKVISSDAIAKCKSSGKIADLVTQSNPLNDL